MHVFSRYATNKSKVPSWTTLIGSMSIVNELNKETALVSVIIPTYNRARLLEESIESVLNQTYRNIEILVIDDGSKDDTKERVLSIEDCRVRYVWRNNAGACAARNTGLELALGEYVAFQDSDDLWVADKLSKQIDLLNIEKTNVCICKMRSLNMQTGELRTVSPRRGKISLESLLMGNYVSTQMILAKKKCFENICFDLNLRRLQDWDLALQLIQSNKFSFVPEELVIQRIQHDSISSNDELLIPACEYIFRKFEREYKKYPKSSRKFKQWLSSLYADIGNIDKALSILKEAIGESFSFDVLNSYITLYVRNKLRRDN